MGKRKTLLVSWILSALYSIYLISYFMGNVASTSGAEQVGAGLATALITLHLVFVLIGLILNIVAWLKSSRSLSLVCAIMYLVAIVLFPFYFFFVIIQVILCFVAFSSLKEDKITIF